MVLPDTSAQQAKRVLARMREKIKISLEEGISVSIGSASYNRDSRNAKDLVQQADQAMYRMKKGANGRSNGKKAEVSLPLFENLRKTPNSEVDQKPPAYD